MRKLFTGIMAAALLCSGTAALADGATYSDATNSVSVDGSGYKTVIITKDGDSTDNGIVYVNQTDSDTFGASAQFLLKENPAAGAYTLRMGGAESGTPIEFSFVIAEEIPVTTTDIAAGAAFTEDSETEGYKDIGFGWEDVSAAEVQTVILQLGDKAYGWEFPTTITGGSANIGIKITDVPESQYNANAKAYLSSKTLAELVKAE